MATTTYSYARDHLAEVWDEAEDGQRPIIIQRRGHQDMALIPAEELASLQETAHLLRSPRNAARLLAALARSERRETPPIEIERLREELGLPAER
ncbi:MAG TPA: type II toxin-antitoxin system Phd/YefM family antitoxin [Candidatus Elarobacter sp.]|nr:type II toxin-antitoxin system Phd/YefM family antitoxin [Candidatus Elarobacter sp.]